MKRYFPVKLTCSSFSILENSRSSWLTLPFRIVRKVIFHGQILLAKEIIRRECLRVAISDPRGRFEIWVCDGVVDCSTIVGHDIRRIGGCVPFRLEIVLLLARVVGLRCNGDLWEVAVHDGGR
jgi:hypothetical protein